ncbi:MAG: LysM peptidoglycan-binding domain-containing protein [Cyclobacteriaceae bacterium]|jgi:membrane-bound lytic murein transglycosylase D|nr:LysM peptidoglycan-binding domain-containing protein [Flammeovirgaceae bacterium]
MKNLLLGFFLVAAMTTGWAQELPEETLPDELDTLETELILDDSVFNGQYLTSEWDYIPANLSPEEVADRLRGIEGEVPLHYNDRVQGFINFFLVRDREYTRLMLRRKDLYFPIFEKELAQHGMPDELKYLSIIESALNPRAISRARAVGLWQFMPATGRYMGLHQDWYLDDRMDPQKSTEAACRYLGMLYSIFHDWELALAAYNSGPGTVRRAMRRSGKNKFWEIYQYLPRETRSYVPQYVAMVYAMNYAEEHNIVEPYREQLPLWDTLRVTGFTNLETLAKLTDGCLDDFQKLNPSLHRNAIPGNGKTFVVRLPLAVKERLELNRVAILDSASKAGRTEIEALAKNAVGNTLGREPMTYRVRSGDVLGSIAMRYGVRVDDIRKWNNLRGNMIRTGQRLTLWVKPSQRTVASATTRKSIQASIAADAKTYTVQPGDTLWNISRKVPGLSIEKIKSLNNLKSNKLQPGQVLIIGS